MVDRRALALIALLLLGAARPVSVDRRAELATANAARRAADARAAVLQASAEAERDEARRAAKQEAAVAARIAGAEAAITAAQARTAIVDRMLIDQRARLAVSQRPVTRLVAALQAMARRPAVLALAAPGSTDDLVHVRAVLGTLVPVVRQRSSAIRADIARTRALRADAALAHRSLAGARGRMQAERLALARLEGEHRLKSRALGRTALFESDRALALGEQARTLIEGMTADADAAATARDLATLDGPLPRAGDALPLPVAGAYRLPVAGRVVEGLGELSPAGVRARGITLETAGEAPVVAPAAGRVLFARRFRGYGLVVIIDHGKGWSSALTGLGAVAVAPGAVVPQGGLVGHAQAGVKARIGVELRRRGAPVDAAQLVG